MKLKKVQEQEFNPLPTEFQLTPFEMLMQDIRARNYKLRKVMVSRPGAAPPPPVCWPPPGDPWERADVAPIPSVTGRCGGRGMVQWNPLWPLLPSP